MAVVLMVVEKFTVPTTTHTKFQGVMKFLGLSLRTTQGMDRKP